MRRTAAVGFIMLTSLLDMMGVGLILPVLPVLVGEFTQDRASQAYWYGALIAGFGAAQFLFAPLLGALSDRYGRRPVLLLGIAGLGTTFLASALTDSLWVLAGVRVLGGALSANIAVAQAYVADVTAPEQRTPALGKLGAMFGLGFLLGPMLGGLLGEPNLRLPFFVAAGLCAINWLYGLLVLPESLPRARRRPIARQHLNPFASLAGLTRLQGVGPLVFAVGADLLAQLMLQSIWVLYTGARFHWGPRDNGYFLFVVGLVAVVVQGGLLRRLLKVLGERPLIVAGMGSGAIAYAAYGLVGQGWMLYVVVIANFLVIASGTALQGVVSKAADPTEQGRTMATLTSLRSVMGIVAYTAGPLLFGQVSYRAPDSALLGLPFFACCALESLAFLIARQYFARHRLAAHRAGCGGAA